MGAGGWSLPISAGAPVGIAAATTVTSGSQAEECAPDLSPDGRAIAYHSGRTGTRDREFVADGRRFYVAIEDRQSDVFVAELVSK